MQLTLKFTLPLLTIATLSLAAPTPSVDPRSFSGNSIAHGSRGNTQVNKNAGFSGGFGTTNNNIAHGNWNTQINNHRSSGYGSPYGFNGNNIAHGYGNFQYNRRRSFKVSGNNNFAHGATPNTPGPEVDRNSGKFTNGGLPGATHNVNEVVNGPDRDTPEIDNLNHMDSPWKTNWAPFGYDGKEYEDQKQP